MLLKLADYYALIFLLPFIVLHFFWRARHYAAPARWKLRALVVTAVSVGISTAVGIAWGTVLPGASLVDGAALGPVGGAVAGILVYEFAHYWYHRAAHSWNWLWRLGHQMHHSAESLDAFGAYYLHPIDAALFTTWAVLVFYPLLGLTPAAGAIAAAFLAFNAAFQHANIRTPRWLGAIVQRPESHAIHHGRGVHAWNYADLPLWDMLFGTYRNPKPGEEPRSAGFYDGASSRLGAMLTFHDVSAPAQRSAVKPAHGLQPGLGVR
jgi:sterol desaturase/sphingolipid hydroxylase (fatty acid hydroxylase superfamily)